MSRNRFRKLVALTQGAAVVGIGVATAGGCATQESAGKDPATLPTPADAPPAASASARTGDAPAPRVVNAAMPQPTDGMDASPAPSSSAPPLRGPAVLNAITRQDGGAPAKLPHMNALPHGLK